VPSSTQPTAEAVCERLSLFRAVKYDGKKNAAHVLMAIEDRCLASALVEPFAHRGHLITKIGPSQRDFDCVHIPDSTLMPELEDSCIG
jgi:hypothetical protein